MPIGRPIRHATPTMSSVPTIAFTMPPPLSPAGSGIWVKKSSERLPGALRDQVTRMKISGRTATMHGRDHEPDHQRCS